MGHPMRLELTRVGLLVKFANRYTTKGAPHRRTVEELFNPLLGEKEGPYLSQRYLSESERNTATRVRTHLL